MSRRGKEGEHPTPSGSALSFVPSIIFLTLLGEIHNPQRESTGNQKASLGHQKETKRNHKETNSNQQEIKWFQRESNKHQQEIHSHEWK